jgi:GNAT superfamily N-acetyltransferase
VSLRPAPKIRPAVPADVPQVFAFIRALARFERLEHEVETEGAVERLHVHLFGPRPACEVLIAEDPAAGGSALGFALFFPVYSTFKTEVCLHLEDLFVLPEARGRGIGEALLRAVAAVGDARGCARVQWNVLDWNRGAIQFYERLGATVLPDWRTCRVEGRAAIRALAGRG